MKFNNIFQRSKINNCLNSGIHYSAVMDVERDKYKSNLKDADGKIIISNTIRFENDYNGLKLDLDGNIVEVWIGDYRQGGNYTLDDIDNNKITIESYINAIKEALDVLQLCKRNPELKDICVSNINNYWKNLIL